MRRNRSFVGPVRRGQRIENVGNGQHARLNGNLRTAQASRVTRAVEQLVVGGSDERHLTQRSAPRNGLQEGHGVVDVALDLLALQRRQATARHL